MKSIVSLLLTAASIAVVSLFGLVTVSLFMAFAAILSLSLFARAMMGASQPQTAKARTTGTGNVKRVWNDGHGMIIDM